MYVVRIYKDYDTNKLLGAKVVDENTLEFRDIEWDILTKAVKNNPNSIFNVEIDKYGKAKLKNMNPKQKIRYYNQHYVDNLVINQYCIITGNRLGKISFIADYDDGIQSGTDVNIGDIASILGISDISKLKLYNAYIEIGNSDYEIYIFRGDNYRKLQKLGTTDVKNVFGHDWGYQVDSIGQDGIRLLTLERINEVGEATVPNGVSYIGEFLGGVNSLILPISVKGLGAGCFEDTDDLYRVVLGKGILYIPEDCFRDSSIREIKLSGSEEEIGDHAFETSMIRGSIVTSAIKIGRCAFSQTGISTLITTRAQEIGVCAFEYCYNLTKVKFDDELRVIKGGAFRGCNKLKEVFIPQHVVHIGKHAFKDCSRLRIARVPISCNIGEDAFPKKCQIIKY